MLIRFKVITFINLLCVSFIAFGTVLAGNTPYPASSVITGINFGTTIVRKARGGDNWPVTWGADGKIYTALGDGFGFAESGNKQSLGISRVSGTSDSFSGEDMGTIKWFSAGPPRIKGTGILMIGGDLYLWSRRDNCSLRKSTDNGTNWSSPILTMEDSGNNFHAIHFLQFGANYANARDSYIYMYATNQGGKYDNYAYLIRVSSADKAIENEDNYEYFTGTASNPTWSYNKADAVAVITDTSHTVIDIRAVYNPGIDRYIVTYNDYDSQGFIAILDAPEPWGPWTAVYYADTWDQGFTFEYNFPAKWIGTDGKTMNMVFSGTGINDAFCVRKTNLTINTTRLDTTPPAVLFTIVSGGGAILSVVFSEAVDIATATNLANYRIDQGNKIFLATLEADQKTVKLSTSAHLEEIIYTLTVKNIQDLAKSPNTIAPNTTISYSYVRGNR